MDDWGVSFVAASEFDNHGRVAPFTDNRKFPGKGKEASVACELSDSRMDDLFNGVEGRGVVGLDDVGVGMANGWRATI
jgi:hypothetical protein